MKCSDNEMHYAKRTINSVRHVGKARTWVAAFGVPGAHFSTKVTFTCKVCILCGYNVDFQ